MREIRTLENSQMQISDHERRISIHDWVYRSFIQKEISKVSVYICIRASIFLFDTILSSTYELQKVSAR